MVGVSGTLLFLFVPETFWDRSPAPKDRSRPKRPGLFSRTSSALHTIRRVSHHKESNGADLVEPFAGNEGPFPSHDRQHRHKNAHVGFAADREPVSTVEPPKTKARAMPETAGGDSCKPNISAISPRDSTAPTTLAPESPEITSCDSSRHQGLPLIDSIQEQRGTALQQPQLGHVKSPELGTASPDTHSEKMSISSVPLATVGQKYTRAWQEAPPKSFSQSLRIYHGRLNHDKWWKVAIRPFILFAYPSVLWSAAVYACSVGWLIVISETVAIIFREGTYKFNAMATGLVYLSPFIGGILGTAVAGKVSDIIVKAMARRNGGLYEPEFRLVSK